VHGEKKLDTLVANETNEAKGFSAMETVSQSFDYLSKLYLCKNGAEANFEQHEKEISPL